ncbi:reverse transcriptase [Caerostris extrusa]|uniref:Reverse transcriptase n=1 Tax=Caerostris extrusa TaxID=172846 RepID=A0AAV4NNY8_CAEEX|nr:reverse transcriptase [Caerostris extrusa]
MNTKEHKAIKVKRGLIRSSVTKLIRRTDEELNKEDKNLDILNDNLTVLLEHKEILEGLDKFIECAINNDDELEKEIEGSLEYTESIVLCKSRVNRYLGKLNKLQELSTLNLSNVTTEPERKLKTNTKLPRISLDKFSKEDLDDILVFHFGPTATAISGLPLTPENYRKAVDILKDRFDTGSARTCITRGLGRRLGLQITGQEELNITAFGGKEDAQSTIQNRVRFLLTDENTEHTMSIEALEIETICPNIMAAPTLSNCPAIKLRN